MTLERIVLSALVSAGLVAAATCESLSTLKLAATTIAAAQAAVEGIAAMQRRQTTVYALQQLHADTGA